MASSDDKRPEKTQGESQSRDTEIPRLRVTDLLGGAKEAILEHEGQLYRLRITSNRKLILTK
jgi:hemin uptake protein HemP